MKNIIEECYLNMENKEKIFAVYSDINSEDKKLTYGEIKNTIIAINIKIFIIVQIIDFFLRSIFLLNGKY